MRATAAILVSLVALAGCGNDDGGAARTGTLSSEECERQFAEMQRQARLHPDDLSEEGRKAIEAMDSGGGVLCARDTDVLTQP